MSAPDLPFSAKGPRRPSQFHTLTIVSLVLLGVCLIWSMVDARLIDGAPVWAKPTKFALSFAVMFGTMALVETRLGARCREGWPLRIVGWVMAAAFLAEMAYMTYQAARGEASHFNMSTPFHVVMYAAVMGTGAVLLVLGVGVMGWVVKRDRAADLGRGLREGIWLGFGLSFILTLVVAGYMSSTSSHFVGLHPEGARLVPLVGWSTVTGDLRPAHFASLHAMQILPLFGLWLDRRGSGAAIRHVRIAAATYAALTLALFAQALAGVPVIALG